MFNDLNDSNEHVEVPTIGLGVTPPPTRDTVAVGHLHMGPVAIKALLDGAAKKGDLLSIARVAALQAAKQTPNLIPLCYQADLKRARVDFEIDLEVSRLKTVVTVTTPADVSGEMEALTAASVALLTFYDMFKAVDKQMAITQVRLERVEAAPRNPNEFGEKLDNLINL